MKTVPAKKCKECGLKKPFSSYYKNRNMRDGHLNTCKDCFKKTKRDAYSNPKHRAKQLAIQRQSRTGWTDKEYKKAFKRQKGKCAICKQVCSSGRVLAADHNHATKKRRGLLCMNCNNGLGRFKDNPALLASAIAYLEGFS